jgi:SiaC family regulatory phosphoprotein
MENLEIAATKSSPEIKFDASTYTLSMAGESYPENTSQFYEPIYQWLDDCLASLGAEKLVLNIELIYFNSSSSKVLMDLFDTLEDASDEGKNIVVNWIYDEENDSALEYGEEFAEDMEALTFNLVEKP